MGKIPKKPISDDARARSETERHREVIRAKRAQISAEQESTL